MDEKLTIGRTRMSGNADLIFAVMVRSARLPLGWRLVPDDEPLSNDWQSDLVFLLTNSLNTGADGTTPIGKEIPGSPNSPAGFCLGQGNYHLLGSARTHRLYLYEPIIFSRLACRIKVTSPSIKISKLRAQPMAQART